MLHLQNIAAFIILSACVCQAQVDGQRATSDTGKVTLQPWLVGLAAVVGFLFIVFVILIVQRLFFKKNKDETKETNPKHRVYETISDLEANEETKQTNF